MRVTHTGSKTFIIRCRIDGRPEYKTLGKFPKLSVENAQKATQEFLSKLARGENPVQQKRDIKAEMTLDEGFALFMDKQVKPHRAIRTIEEYERMYKLHVGKLGNKRLTAITYQDIDRLHANIGKNRGKYIANRVVAVLQATYTWLAKKRHYSGENPAWGIERFKEESRDRFLQTDELPKFFDALANEDNITIRDYVLLSLMTGARKENILSMRWEDIDLTQEVWRIPNTKSQEPANIPLIPAALQTLIARRERITSEWVFPSRGKKGHLADPKRAWRKLLDRAGIENLRLHDLRRSMGSWQAINQTSLTVIAKSLGQKSTQAAAVYSRLNLDPVRESMEQAARSMMSFKDEPIDSNVTPLKKAGK